MKKALRKLDKNIGKAVTGNSHAGVAALIKNDANNHKDAVKGFREMVGLSNNTKTINESVLTPATVEISQPVVATPPAFTQQVSTPVVNNVPQTANISQVPDTTTATANPNLQEDYNATIAASSRGENPGTDNGQNTNDKTQTPIINTANASEAINENEQANIAIATNASLEEGNSNAATVTTSNETSQDHELVQATAASLKTQELRIYAKRLVTFKKITDSLIEYGVVGRSQQRDIDALKHEDIADLDQAMKESLKDKTYDENIKNGLIAFYNKILKLTTEKELPRHVLETLNKHTYGEDATQVFEDLLKEDDKFILKLAQETDRKEWESFFNLATESKIDEVSQLKLNEEDFTKVELKKEDMSPEKISLLEGMAANLIEMGKLNSKQLEQTRQLSLEDMPKLLELMKHEHTNGYSSTLNIVSGMVEFCKLAHKLAGNSIMSENHARALHDKFFTSFNLNHLNEFLKEAQNSAIGVDNSSSDNNEINNSDVLEEKKSEISSSNIASQETNSFSELQNMLDDALNAGNQSLVDEILNMMGDGNHN